MYRYLAPQSHCIYLLTFFVAVTIDWAIPRLMPGDPIDGLISRIQAGFDGVAGAARLLHKVVRARPAALAAVPRLLARARARRPRAEHRLRRLAVSELIWAPLPYTLALLVPAIVLSYIAGQPRRRDRRSPEGARQHGPPGRLRPDGDAVHVARARPRLLPRLPVGILPGLRRLRLLGAARLDLEFASSFLSHWFLPFLSLFLVSFGGWAIGMRNMIIYELESDYANYLQALGAPSKLVRKYALRQRGAAADVGPRARARRRRRRRARDRDRLRLPRASARSSSRRFRTATSSCSRASSCSSSSAC